MGDLYVSPAGLINETTVGGHAKETNGLSCAKFAIYFIDRLPWLVTHQEMNSAVDCIAFPFPAGGHSSLYGMVLEDMGLISIHLWIAACGKTRKAGPMMIMDFSVIFINLPLLVLVLKLPLCNNHIVPG